MCSKSAAGMANSVDLDQTAPWEQSGLGLHSLLRSVCPITSLFTVMHLSLRQKRRHYLKLD